MYSFFYGFLAGKPKPVINIPSIIPNIASVIKFIKPTIQIRPCQKYLQAEEGATWDQKSFKLIEAYESRSLHSQMNQSQVIHQMNHPQIPSFPDESIPSFPSHHSQIPSIPDESSKDPIIPK
ncbi:hypothetical protein CEXT_196951 [Caerostris extrusa]|uniref:Uncharacterized protein n=1 Tax=Caerostris extrusa TaxID=172846 RepID=A0AAV4NBR3_CAEEX|nr:hypothetical protein CEXT_196951 [Caerostris extrusa]